MKQAGQMTALQHSLIQNKLTKKPNQQVSIGLAAEQREVAH